MGIINPICYRLQAPTEERIQNDEIQPVKSANNRSAANKDGYADKAVDQSNIEHNEDAAEVSAVVHVKEHIPIVEAQLVSLTKENPETMSPVKPEERPIVFSTAEYEGEYADIAFDESSEHSEIPVSAGVHVEDLIAETSAAASTEESRNTADVLAVLALNLIPQKVPSTKTVPTNVEIAGGESAVQPAEGGCDKFHPEQAAEVEAVEVAVKPSPDKSCVINATPGEQAALQDTVEAAPDLQEKAESELSTATAEALAKANVEPLPKTQAVTDVSREDVTPQASVEALPDLLEKSVSKSSTAPAAEAATGESCEKVPSEQTVGEPVKDIAMTIVEASPETSAMADASREVPAHQDTVEATPHLLEKSVSSEPAPEIASEGSCEKVPQEKAAEEPVEAAAKANVESKPEIPAVSNASGEQAAFQDSVERVPALVTDSVSELPTQPAAEPAVQSVECKVESSAEAEADLQTRREEVECEVQPADNTVVEQSLAPIPKSAEDHTVELSIEDAVKPGDAVQDRFANSITELTDALDVKPPTTEASPEPLLKEPEQSHTEHTKVNQQSDNTDM